MTKGSRVSAGQAVLPQGKVKTISVAFPRTLNQYAVINLGMRKMCTDPDRFKIESVAKSSMSLAAPGGGDQTYTPPGGWDSGHLSLSRKVGFPLHARTHIARPCDRSSAD